MPSFTYLTAALALTGAVIANPVQLEKRHEFTINQVKRSQFLKIGAKQKAKTMSKYGQSVPPQIINAIEKYALGGVSGVNSDVGSPVGTVTTVPGDQYDSLYLSPVTVGSDKLFLEFDTGSADLWAVSSLMTKDARGGHNYYKADQSKRKNGYTWNITYGDGSGASGKVYTDQVQVGPVIATSQAVEAALQVSELYANTSYFPGDGFLGLSFSNINMVQPVQQMTFFDNVKSHLTLPLFAVTLKYHAAGSYDFGYIDKSKYTGEITYVNVDKGDETRKGYWSVTATGYKVGGGAIQSLQMPGFLDTGTTLVYTDDAAVAAYYAQVPGARSDDDEGGYIFPCSAKLPDFSLIFGGSPHTIPGRYVNYAPLTSTSPTCYGGIQAKRSLTFSVFGDIFLKSQYVVHENDGVTPRIGLAQQAGVA